MGKVGSAGDNAAMGSFFSILQRKVLDTRRTWHTRQDLRLAIVTWIERDYHRRLRQDRLGRLTPIECETKMTAAPPARTVTTSCTVLPSIARRSSSVRAW